MNTSETIINVLPLWEENKNGVTFDEILSRLPKFSSIQLEKFLKNLFNEGKIETITCGKALKKYRCTKK